MLPRALRDELGRTGDRERLRAFARRWPYEHRLFVPRERELRRMVLQALRRHEAELAEAISREIEPLRLAEWSATLNCPRESGTTTQTWLWAAPAKHSTRQIEEVLARVECLYGLGVDRQLLLMVRRRVAELWRMAAAGLESPTTDWAKLYQDLVRDLGADRQPPAEAGEPSRCPAIRSTAFSAGRRCDQAGSSTLL